jgi:DivIVA domain-containing protein
VSGVDFHSSRRGYDREQVDRYVEQVSRIVVELEAMRSPDAVIERALADVGEETSAILRRARKAAEEIVADADSYARERAGQAEAQGAQVREEADRYSSKTRADADRAMAEARARAEEVVVQAEAEAARIRGEADRDREQVIAHIEQLAAQRHRLIEDLRKLADQFHRTADRAVEQIAANEPSYGDVTPNGDTVPAQGSPT